MKWLKRSLIVLAVLLVGIQFIRPSLANPPVDATKTIDAAVQVPADVQSILERSCYDCHSNKTVWPWYSNVAPVSWLLADDVKDGRKELNFSEWGTYKERRKSRKLKELCEEVKESEMPPALYVPMHPHAKLSDADRTRLCEWSTALRGGK